ncbi:hypothetical protein Ahy_B01g055471 [Arachis hypogaea]|uniref:Ubiquitin-like protease family profile domain-containing protein n=1 Tax=Arachis hypogaea TaxID=3818 RepID=A0A445AWE9_ARAHY|nr:hypothetical protein Ahy_B01g055471 [Arachis hypogaea]
MTLILLCLHQTKDLKCATHLLSEKFRNMSEEKKAIVRDLRFGGLMHIPPLRVHHQILKELANSFKLEENRVETGYGDLLPQKVNYKDLSEDDKQIFRRFQGKTLKNLTDEMMAIGVDNEQDHLMFKRIFILYIQMVFLLPKTINKISPGITDYNLKKKKAIDGCLFALMIVYFHLSKNKDKKGAERPQEPWIANWTREHICWGAPLKTRDKDKEIEPPYLHISGQKTSYDCAIYVMKWLEILQPENIKRLKYEWDNWTQDEVDHFRVEYASCILFHEMNQDKAEAIRGSNAIRLSKPSSLLLSPYCQIDSKDIDTD